MDYRKLGHSGIDVSLICLGTMTWGEQNTEAEAHEQLDRALAAGVNFIDTAEMYPIPPQADTYSLTEQYIGNWLKQRGARDQVILATKVASRAEWLSHIRDGNLRLDRQNIESALHDSLKRLQTDYIDLYQLHWPERPTNFFGRLGYKPSEKTDFTPIEETLKVLADLVDTGKIRHIGISNETPWGAMRFLQLADQLGLPRIVSIQNPYNLLNRTYEIGLAEISHRENVGLLAYSPLGFGVLSGKYLDGASPPGTRLTLYPHYSRYTNPRANQATERYVALAQQYGLEPSQMALAYLQQQPFVTSTVIGTTTLEQLESNLASVEIDLDKEILKQIEAIHEDLPNPSP